jgi:hypothetical protein
VQLKFGALQQNIELIINEKRHDWLQAQTCSTLRFVCPGTFESEAELGSAIVQINGDTKRWKTDVLPPG